MGTLCARLGRLFAMSTPETPPQTPTKPVAPDAASAPIEPSAPPVEAARNGKPSDAESGAEQASPPYESPHGAASHQGPEGAASHEGPEGAASHEGPEGAASHEDAEGAASHEGPDDAGSQDDAPDEEGGPAGGDAPQGDGSTATPAGERKRRRRRRKKKGGAPATGDAATAASASAEHPADAEAAPGEGTTEPGAEAQHADRSEKRDRKKEKKHGPPRERPPVNGGDIVFGKILEITDDAIIVDIPGKAHAIFDRHEMLLPDEEEQTRQAEANASAAAAAQAAAGPIAGEAPAPIPADAAEAVADASEPAPGAEVTTSELAEAVGTPIATPIATPDVEAEPTAVAREPPREPKVPRVILEVGADFIAVVHNDGARGGLVVLTHHPNRGERAKPVLEKAFQDKTTVLGLVTGVIKGGVEVDVDGLRAFAPGSHVDLRMGADLSHLVAQRLPFLVTQYAKRGRDVVLSRKTMIEDEARNARTEALAKLKVGEDLDGIVRSVVPFGAFIDVGGIEGLVPLQEMSHNRADGPSDVFKAGEATRVRVMKIDDRGKIWLSRRATMPDPWQKVAEKYAHGTRHTGKIVRLQPFGAFVELEAGVDGLIHTQDLSIKRIEVPSDVVKVGDSIEVVVAHVDPTQHKISLHPAPEGDFANEPVQRVVPHKPVKARVALIESGGLVVRILGVTGRSARGYITAAGTGTPRGTELRKAFKVGQDVDAKVLEVDPRRGEVKLSIKALSEEQERSAYQQYRQQLKAEARFTLADLLTKKSPR
jgi:small subunit ribosomal protein S1